MDDEEDYMYDAMRAFFPKKPWFLGKQAKGKLNKSEASHELASLMWDVTMGREYDEDEGTTDE